MIKACDEFTLPDSPRWRAIACLLSHRRQTSLPHPPRRVRAKASCCSGMVFVTLQDGPTLHESRGKRHAFLAGEQKGFVRRRYYARLFYACTYSV